VKLLGGLVSKLLLVDYPVSLDEGVQGCALQPDVLTEFDVGDAPLSDR
jgi:hypothetical protein